MTDLLKLLNKELVIELVVVLFFVIFLVVTIIDGLKKLKIIKPDSGKAATWSQGLNSALGLLGYVLVWLGAGAKIDGIQQMAMIVASSVLLIIPAILGSKLWYEALKWVRGKRQTQTRTFEAVVPAGPKVAARTG